MVPKIEKGPGGGLSTEKEHLALYRTSCASPFTGLAARRRRKKLLHLSGKIPISVRSAELFFSEELEVRSEELFFVERASLLLRYKHLLSDSVAADWCTAPVTPHS